MKVNQGAFCPLSGAGRPVSAALVFRPPSPSPSPSPAAMAVAACPPRARPAAPVRWSSRRGPRRLVALGAGLLVLGCAAVDPAPWQVQPTYRVQDSGPAASRAYLALARQHEGALRTAQAIGAYQKAAQAAPDDAEVHNALGLALARDGQYTPAVLALRRAVALAPDQARLLNNLGYALMLDGRMQEARSIIRLTLALAPDHAQARRNLRYSDEQLAVHGVPAGRAVTAGSAAPPRATPATTVTATAVVAPAVGVAPAAPATTVAAAALAAPAASAVAPPAAAPASASAAAAVAVATAPALAPAPRVPAPLPPLVSLDGVRIEIVNGNGIAGMAARLRGWLRERGVTAGRLANQLPFDQPQTQVLYRSGMEAQARSMALRLPVVAHVLPAPPGSGRGDLRVLIGHDVIYSAGCSELSVCATPERLSAAAARPQ